MGYGDNLTYGKKHVIPDSIQKVYIGTGRNNRKNLMKEFWDSPFRGGWMKPPEGFDYEDYCYNDIKSIDDLWPRIERIRKNEIRNVIFNNPATIVFWGDGSKTVVKCNGDEFDPEKGLAMAIAKHFMGTSKSKGNYYKVFEEWLPCDVEKVVKKSIKEAEEIVKKKRAKLTEDTKLDD